MGIAGKTDKLILRRARVTLTLGNMQEQKVPGGIRLAILAATLCAPL